MTEGGDADNENDQIKVRALPSGTDSLRGQGFDFTIVEEMAFVSDEQLVVGVSARLTKKLSVLVGITTPSTDVRKGTEHLEKFCWPGTQLRLFRTMKFEVKCKACRDANVAECTHVKTETPYWIDDRRRVIGMAFCARNPKLFSTEFLGVDMAGNPPCFDGVALSRLFDEDSLLATLPHNLPWLGVFVDPSGGGDSLTGIVSCGYTTDPAPRLVVGLYFTPSLRLGRFLVIIISSSSMTTILGEDDGRSGWTLLLLLLLLLIRAGKG